MNYINTTPERKKHQPPLKAQNHPTQNYPSYSGNKSYNGPPQLIK